MSTLAIQTEGLSRLYGRQAALDRLDLRVQAGRIVALLGPNGAGKTTLLRLLAGLLAPTAGGARVLGDDSRRLSPANACRLGVMIEGHEPPHWARLRWLAALQASAAPRCDSGLAERLLGERHLDGRARFGRLSKGQRRWVLAALALASHSDVLLLDEPADGLDPASRRALYGHLRDQANDLQSAVLVATHIIDDIERVADEVAVLHHGRLLLHADLEDLREQVREVEVPATALLPAQPLEVLATGVRGDRRSVWIRGDEAVEARIADQLGGGAAVHPFNLERLFLALTSDAAAADGRHASANEKEEVARCA